MYDWLAVKSSFNVKQSMDSSIIDPKDSSNNWADQSANHIKPSYRDVISAKVLFTFMSRMCLCVNKFHGFFSKQLSVFSVSFRVNS